MVNAIPFWLWWILGFIAGFGFMLWRCCQRKEGVIHVTLGQGEEADKYLFEFNIPPEDIPNMQHVVFEVQIDKSQNLQGA